MTCGSAASKARLSLFLERAHELGRAFVLRAGARVLLSITEKSQL
jgi:hypothetical protein